MPGESGPPGFYFKELKNNKFINLGEIGPPGKEKIPFAKFFTMQISKYIIHTINILHIV